MSGADLARLHSALSLAARGWHVFPCAPGGKRPALRGNWQALATRDPGRICGWWASGLYNIGVACGPSGLVVLDLDVPGSHSSNAGAAPGTDALASLCTRHGQPHPLPTYAVGTPSGGIHLYYEASGAQVRNSAGRLGPLVDVRARGGYVIGPGSSLGSSTYTVRHECQPAALPGWIARLAAQPPAPAGRRTPALPAGRRGTAYAQAALREEARQVAAARPGTRNDTLNRAAFSLGQLTAAGLIPAPAVATALTGAARQAGLAEDEARRTIRSGMTAGMATPRRPLHGGESRSRSRTGQSALLSPRPAAG